MISIGQSYKRAIEGTCSGEEKTLRLKAFEAASEKRKVELFEQARRELRAAGKMMTK